MADQRETRVKPRAKRAAADGSAENGAGQAVEGDGASGKKPASPQRRRAKQAKRRAKKARAHAPSARKSPLKTVEGNFEQLVRSRRSGQVTIEQPVALISQAPRSGGTLLRNLFDGHPQCHVHPYEWHFGPTRRFEWPSLRLDGGPALWWTRVREEELSRRFVNGVRRNPTKYRGQDKAPRGEVYPLLLPPMLQRQIFMETIADLPEVRGDRDIINAYMTSLFNGWLNNHTLDQANKLWVVAFAPRLAWGKSRESYFDAYPDGHLIAVLRSPPSWLASARGRQIKGAENNDRLIAMWNRSAEEMIAAKAERPDSVSIIRFDDLVRNSEGVMRLLSRTLKLEYADVLTDPTFNSQPIGANSSYAGNNQGGVISAPVDRHKEVLSNEDQELIAEQCGPLYDEAAKLADRPRARETAKKPRSDAKKPRSDAKKPRSDAKKPRSEAKKPRADAKNQAVAPPS